MTEQQSRRTSRREFLQRAGLTAGLGLDWGTPVPVVIEDQSPNVFGNHSIVHLTDALAVQSLLGALSVSSDIESLNTILYAASNQNDLTLEATVNALGELFRVGATVTGAEPDARDALYRRIHAIQSSIAYQSAAQNFDTTQVISLAELVAQEKSCSWEWTT